MYTLYCSAAWVTLQYPLNVKDHSLHLVGFALCYTAENSSDRVAQLPALVCLKRKLRRLLTLAQIPASIQRLFQHLRGLLLPQFKSLSYFTLLCMHSWQSLPRSLALRPRRVARPASSAILSHFSIVMLRFCWSSLRPKITAFDCAV